MTTDSPPSFLTSATAVRQFPPDAGREVAFAGRSNSGKSTALNLLLRRRKLARTSKTPGRTRMINFFELDAGRRVVDLPGYGYAQVSAAMRSQWEDLLRAYFEGRRSLAGLMVTVDIRRGIGATDSAMIDWARAFGLPVTVLLTKADKLSREQARRQSAAARATVEDTVEGLVVFSAQSREGVDEARACLDRWLGGA